MGGQMKGLVLSGGGAKGGYSVGALQHLLGDLEINYDIICGVSVGAINGAFLSQFSSGQEKLAACQLTNMWAHLNTSKIYKRWFPFGGWHALWNKSFYDSLPLHKLIQEAISLDKIRSSGKQIGVGAVSLSSGKYHIFTKEDDDFINAVLASSAFPGMLTPIKMKGQLWVDGGVKELSPIRTAIDMGATHIDVITTSPEIRIKKFLDNPSVVDIFKRVIDLSTDKILSNDIEKVVMYNKLAQAGVSDRKVVELRVFRPYHNLVDDVLDFSPHKIREMMDKGYRDAKDILG
jgi:NTE family protein